MAGQKHALLIGIDRYPFLDGKDLAGCLNDVALLGAVLQERFGFLAENVRYLRDAEATRTGILAAFDALIDRVGADDIVAVVYAGHGSRLSDPHGAQDLRESIVAYDSGRGARGPNRDVLDYEVDWFVQRLNAKTPYVSLVFDCCHSGSVTRDAFGSMTREVEPDTRSIEVAFPDALPPLPPRGAGALVDAVGAGGWLPGSRSAVVLAACDASELANEHRAMDGDSIVRHGAMTWFLSRALLAAPPGATWRDVFEAVAPRIQAEHPRQHPQLEGKTDELLFGTSEHRPAGYLRVVSVDRDQVVLAGGAAHGVTSGSVYAIHAHGSHAAGPVGTELGLARVDAAQATTSSATLTAGEGLEAGMRAFVRVQELREPALRICIDAPQDKADEVRRLGAFIDDHALLRLVPRHGDADVLVRLLAPRTVVGDGALLPALGALPTWTWAAVGGDGRLVIKTVPHTAAAAKTVSDALAAVSRFRNLLGIHNPDASSAIGSRVRVEVERWVPARMGLQPATPEAETGVVLFEEGESAEFVLTNEHREAVWVSLVQFGADGAIELLLPLPGHPTYDASGVRLAPGQRLAVAADYYGADRRFAGRLPHGLPLHLPQGFPWAAEPGEDVQSGLVTLKLLVTQEPTDFSFLTQGATRAVSASAHPVARMAALYGAGKGTRSFLPTAAVTEPEADWAAVDLPVGVRRPRQGVSLPDDGAPMTMGAAIIRAPGLGGRVTLERGMSSRTRSLGASSGPLDGALDAAGMRSVLTIEVEETRPVTTRSAQAPPRMEDGAEAIELTLPDPGPAARQLVMVTDESGAISFAFPTTMDDGSQRFLLPARVAEPPPPAVSATRSIVTRGLRKVFRVVAYEPTRAAIDLAAKAGVAAWEERKRPYGLRRFVPDNYQAESTYRPGQSGPRAFQANDWRDMGRGRSLLFVHGTFSRSWLAFGGLDRETMQRLYDRYEGRVFAFDHKTLTEDPDDNLAWFLEQQPPGVTLDCDIVSHSRGGLVGRVFAERGPARSGGRLRVGKVVFAGAPNSGTVLTETEHLKTFIEVVTNTLNAFPVPGPQDVVEGVLEIAKLIAVGAVDALRGLQSMRPDGPWLAALNAPSSTAPPGDYYGMGSSFREDCDGFSHLAEGFRVLASGKLANTIFMQTNDLVVPAEGVFEGNGHPAFPLSEERVLFFGSAEGRGGERMGIDHSGYFTQPIARSRLIEWLSA